MLTKRIIFAPLIGLSAGVISSLLGAGGGMIVVPSLLKLGINQQKAHAASVCIMLPICIIGSIMYINSEFVSFGDAIPYLPLGVIGAIMGSVILPKINQRILRRIFGCFSIWAAFRLLTK